MSIHTWAIHSLAALALGFGISGRVLACGYTGATTVQAGTLHIGADGTMKFSTNWSQWRGPDRSGVSADTGLLKTWPKEGPALVWKATGLGHGYSGISTDGVRIYTLGADAESCYLRAMDMDGKILWSTRMGKSDATEEEMEKRGSRPGPRSTPTVVGGLVYALGKFGELICVDAATGEEKWHKEMDADFDGKAGQWGYSESPLADGERLVVTPGAGKGAVVALDRTTGNVLWRTEDVIDKAAYTSIVIAEIEGVRQYVHLTQAHVFGLAPESGKVLWKAARKGASAVVPTPVVAGNQVFVTSGYGVGCNLFKITRTDDGFDAEQVYANKNMINHHGGVVLIGGHIYGLTDAKKLVCVDMKTGEVAWSDPSVGKGSITAAEGHLYVRGEGPTGTVALVEATPEGYREKGRFNQPDRSRKNPWAHPVISAGKLYLRDQDVLLCYQLREK